MKLRGSGSLTVYGRGWRSATLDMFIPGTLTVEYDDPDGGAVPKTDEGTEGAAICANVTLDNGILRATGPDFASADDGSSVGLRGRLTTHGSSVEASSPPAPAMPAMVCTSTNRAVAGATPGPWDWAR